MLGEEDGHVAGFTVVGALETGLPIARIGLVVGTAVAGLTVTGLVDGACVTGDPKGSPEIGATVGGKVGSKVGSGVGGPVGLGV